MSQTFLSDISSQPNFLSQPSQLTELTQVSFDTQEELDPSNVSPPTKGWINQHFRTVFIGRRKARVCLSDGCGKKYAYASSTRVFKDHWSKCHLEDPYSRHKRTRFLFHDQLHTNRLIKAVIALKLNYSIVDKLEFRQYAESLNPNLPFISRQTLVNAINYSKLKLAEKVKQKLEEAKSVALTFDIWSARKGSRGFGCVTAHYVNSDGKLENLILHFEHMKFPHDAKTISKFILRPIAANNLQGKIAAITTDNASNNIAAIRQLDKSLGLTWLNLGFIHYKCVAHIIDLGLKNAMKSLKETIAPVRDAVMAIRSSRKRKEKFSDKQQELIREGLQQTKNVLELAEDVDHRWNSCLILLERAYVLRRAIDYMKVTTKAIQLPPIDWTTIDDIIKFLRPFNEVTKALCSGSDVTISIVAFSTPRLINHCADYEHNENQWLREAAESMQAKLTAYETELYHPVVDYAYFLDPRYKTKYMSDDNRARTIRQIRELIKVIPSVEPRLNSTTSSNKSILGEDSDSEDTTDEINNYCERRRESLKTDVLFWWRNNSDLYPKLSEIALRILPIQSTSVASERVFSVAGGVDTKSRNRLEDTSVENIILFMSWMQFLQIE